MSNNSNTVDVVELMFGVYFSNTEDIGTFVSGEPGYAHGKRVLGLLIS